MTKAAWAQAIEAELDAAGIPTQAAMAGHIRAAAATESHLLRSRVIRALKESYAPFGADETVLRDAIVATLDALSRVGDLTVFHTDGGPGFIATPERLVDLGGDEVAILGMSQVRGATADQVVRRLPRRDAVAQTGAPVIGLAEEVGLAAWRTHLVEVGGFDAVASGPQALFSHLAGLAIGGERLEVVGFEALRVVAGRGSFFGKAQAAKPDGRWSAWDGQGTYCAARRRSYNWQDCILAATPSGPRVLDVADPDRWRWAVVGQTRSLGDGVAAWTDGVFQSLTPPPFQVQRLLAIAGPSEGPWQWRVGGEAANLAAGLLGQDGY